MDRVQVKVPLNYRQSFKWVGNLDASSLLLVGAGGVLAFRMLTAHVPWGVKAPVMVLSGGVAVTGMGMRDRGTDNRSRSLTDSKH